MLSEAELWLIQFFFARRPPRADGRPLYAYRVSELEYQALEEALRAERRGWQDPGRLTHWAACYAIYVAESYRRKYDSEIGWTWAAFDTPLALTIPVGDRGELVREGMRYWQRPIRKFESGNNDYLGSLFAEGGLPWSLLSSGHVFGRAVRSAVRHFEHDRESGRAPSARIAESMPAFPQSFRTEHVCLLLAGIVSQLIAIVARCRLQNADDPISVLDRESPSWRDDFPIPLDNANAHQLVSDWLIEAKRARDDWAQRQRDRPSRCAHRLGGSSTDLLSLRTVVEIQREIRFPRPTIGLSSTRLELACYEGERLVQRIGVAYADFVDDAVRIRSPKAQIELRRGSIEQPLILKVLASGATIHSIDISDSTIDAESSPAIFEIREDVWWYLSSVSCRTQSKVVRVRLPSDWRVTSGCGNAVDSQDGATWLDVSATLTVGANDEEVCIDFGDADAFVYRLSGATHLGNARPSQIFLGWPRLVCDGSDGNLSQLQYIVNGRRHPSHALGGAFGSVRLQLRNAAGLTLFRDRFGLLPADFHVRRVPAQASNPACIGVTSREPLLLTACVGANPGVSWSHVGESSQLLPDPAHLAPAEISLAVRSASNPDPLILRFPFPFVGVQVTDADGVRVPSGALTLADLLGMEAVLYSGPGGATTFSIALQLRSGKGGSPQQYSTIRVGEDPVSIRLSSFSDDIAMLLGVTSDQDAQVRMSFDSNGTEHLVFHIGRYKHVAVLGNEGAEVFVTAMGDRTPIDGAAVAAMCIPEPGDAPIPLMETHSQGTALGLFRIPEHLQSDGPWILCAPADARFNFRPLFVLGNPQGRPMDAIGAIGTAVRQYHPHERPGLIAEQVAEMAADSDHDGWDYLRKLKESWSHLPLSVFEVWKAVACNPRSLVQAVLRLELSTEFCQRIESELAVIWEAVPLQAWRDALDSNGAWRSGLGLPQTLLDQLRDSGIRRFKQLWPGFDHLEDFLHGRSLRMFPFEKTMPVWHMALCRQQAQNDHWPTQCGMELRTWALQQPLPDLLKNLPGHSFMNAVTFLPMFLGSVSAGKSPLELPEVSTRVLKHAIRHVADFDRQWFASAHALMTSHFSAEP